MTGIMGLVGSGLACNYALYVVIVNIVLARITPGWTTLSRDDGLFFLLF
jgi:hypothetical protein